MIPYSFMALISRWKSFRTIEQKIRWVGIVPLKCAGARILVTDAVGHVSDDSIIPLYGMLVKEY